MSKDAMSNEQNADFKKLKTISEHENISFSSESSATIHFLLGYETINNKFKESASVRVCKKINRRFGWIKSLKKFISHQFEISFIAKIFSEAFCKIFEKSLRYYGVILLFYSIITLAASVINLTYDMTIPFHSELPNIIFGVTLMLSGSIITIFKKSLATFILESKLLSYFLFEVLCLERKKFESVKYVSATMTVPILLGSLCGLLFHFIKPTAIIAVAVTAVFTFAVIATPETGIIVTFLSFPFLYENQLTALIAVCCFSFVIKALRNKRFFKIGLIEISSFFFALAVLFSGINGVFPFSSIPSALKIILILFFGWIVSNSAISTKLVKRIIYSLLFSVTLSSAIGILLFLFKRYGLNDSFFAIRITEAFLKNMPFANQKYAMELAIIAIPFSLAYCKNSKILGICAVILNVAYIGISFELPVWIAVISEFILYFCAFAPIAFIVCIAIILLIIAFCLGFPQIVFQIGERLSELLNNILFNNLSFYNFTNARYIGEETAKKFLYSGIGSGNYSLNSVIKYLFNSGTVCDSSEIGFCLNIIIQYGLFAFLALIAVYVFFISNSISLMNSRKCCDSILKPYLSAGISALSAILFNGMFYSYLSTSHAVLFAVTILFLSVSISRSVEIEYIPDEYEVLIFEEN